MATPITQPGSDASRDHPFRSLASSQKRKQVCREKGKKQTKSTSSLTSLPMEGPYHILCTSNGHAQTPCKNMVQRICLSQNMISKSPLIVPLKLPFFEQKISSFQDSPLKLRAPRKGDVLNYCQLLSEISVNTSARKDSQLKVRDYDKVEGVTK